MHGPEGAQELPVFFSSNTSQRFSTPCLKCSVNVMMYVGDPEHLGVIHMMCIY